MNDNAEYLVALDAGSEKIFCVVGKMVEASPNANEPESRAKKGAETQGRVIRVISTGVAPSRGIRNGVVVDLEAAVTSVGEALHEAEAGCDGFRIERVIATLGGSVLRSANCTGTAVVRNNEVHQADIEEAERNARANAKKQGPELIKLHRQFFECDGSRVSDQPLGLACSKLNVKYHAVYGSLTNAENMKRCLLRNGVELDRYLPHPIASAIAVLTKAEKYCGTLVIDLGAQTSSIAIYHEDVVLYTHVQPFGAEYFTRDVAMVFGLTMDDAEKLKQTAGHCVDEKFDPMEICTVPSSTRQMRSVSRRLLARTLRARAQEFFGLYRRLIEEAGYLEKVSNVVITGGGAKLEGLAQVAEDVFGKPVRVGRALNIEPETPRDTKNTACLGLLLERLYEANPGKLRRKHGSGGTKGLKRLFFGDYV